MTNLENLILILLYCGLVMQCFVMLANPMRVNKKANFFFGIFLFLWSCYWLMDILKICGIFPNATFTFFIYFIQIFTPIFLLFSVVFFINPNYEFRNKDAAYLIVPLAYLFLLINSENNRLVIAIADFVSISHNLPYIAFIYFRIKKHQRKIENISSNTENIDLQWLSKLSMLLLGIIIITVGYELFNAVVYKLGHHLVMDAVFLFTIYSTFYSVLQQKEIYPVDKQERVELLSVEFNDSKGMERKKLITDEDFEELKQKLVFIMHSEKPYLDGELNLSKLSSLVGINPHQLSYLLNQGFDENFFQFVNKYRIENAKKMLVRDSSQKFSILGIAFESGFNSKTSFNTIFKKLTGETPSEFRKKHSDL